LNRNQLRILTGLFTEHCHLTVHLFKLGLIDSPECDRCKQASETASHVLGDCEALAAIRFSYLGYHFMKPGDFKDISVSRLLHFCSKCGAAKQMNTRAAQRIRNG
jgi:ribosomal protein S27AE